MLGKIAYKMINILLILVMLGCGTLLEIKLNGYRLEKQHRIETSMEARKGRTVDFPKLKERNPDVLGWIYLPDSNIDYPVVQGSDNEYYVHHDLDGNYLYDGCIFVDSTVKDPFRDFNTVIYGHRMRSGAMFNHLGKYKDRDFFDSHRTIIIETEDASYDLHIIAFCAEYDDSKLYTTRFRESSYETEDSGAGKRLTKQDFTDLIREKAVILSDEEFGEEDTFVTLSTCAYATGDERNQVIGILKPPRMEEKYTEVVTANPTINRWLMLQVAVGLIMATIILVPLLRTAKKRN